MLSESAEFQYKCTNYYTPENEHTLDWDDPVLNIDWPIAGDPVLSAKDVNGLQLQNVKTYGG